MNPGPYCPRTRYCSKSSLLRGRIAWSTLTFSSRMASELKDDRGFHRDKREQLHHVVLHDIAEKPCFFEKMAPRADADVFGDGDLDMVDMADSSRATQRWSWRSGRREGFGRFLCRDSGRSGKFAIHRGCLEMSCLERFRRVEIVAERFFDDDAGPLVLLYCGIVDQPALWRFSLMSGKKFG